MFDIYTWDIDARVATFTLALALAVTDLFDGLLAKLLRQKSDFGKKIDPIADASFCISLFITVFAIYSHFFILLYAWTAAALYFTWYAMNVSHMRRDGKIDAPNRSAKLGMCALMTSMLLVICGTFATPVYVWHMLAIVGVVTSMILTLDAYDTYQKAPQCANCSCTKC
jgi:phosphatidylglycerophosphate synthase